MKEHLPPGISIAKSENLEEWQMDIRVLDENPLYQNQVYRLKFTFSSKYPIGKFEFTPWCYISTSCVNFIQFFFFFFFFDQSY